MRPARTLTRFRRHGHKLLIVSRLERLAGTTAGDHQLLQRGGGARQSARRRAATSRRLAAVVHGAWHVPTARAARARPISTHWGAVVDWVEKGVPPDTLLAGKPPEAADPKLERPLCPFPKVAQYKGNGDTSDAASFRLQSTLTLKPGVVCVLKEKLPL